MTKIKKNAKTFKRKEKLKKGPVLVGFKVPYIKDWLP